MKSHAFYLKAQALSYEWPSGEQIFNHLDFTINHARYALVGDNGVGKTTLAKILSGGLEPSSGSLLSSEPLSKSVVLLEQTSIQTQYKGIPVHQYLLDLWESAFADPMLYGPLISEIDLDADITTLSGGEWTRVRIAKALASPCQLLILDEPSNNLDIGARDRLIQFIKSYTQSALLLISHDRALLEHVDFILELSNRGISTYGGNFSFYYEEKIKERALQEEKLGFLQRQKKKTEEEWRRKVIAQEKRMRQGSKNKDKAGETRMIAGLKKRKAENTLNKIQKNEAERFQEKYASLNQALHSLKIDQVMRIKIPEVHLPQGKRIFEVSSGNILFENSKRLWQQDFTYILKGPRRIALMGANGAGKSSFIKALLGTPSLGQNPVGEWILGDIPMQVLDQNYSLLDLDKSVLENIIDTSALTATELRNHLALMQFEDDKVFQSISTLSGGEKLKVSLAKIFFSNPAPEFLILDEPTNNLDLNSLETLEACLKQYKGALLVISHDKVFLEKISIDEFVKLPARGVSD